MLLFNGTSFKVSGTLVLAAVLFALLSSLFMILYGDGTHVLFKWGFIQVSIESLVRGLHVSLRTISVSMFGILLALTSQIVMIFYSLMQHLKVKPKIAYAFICYSYGTTYFTSFIQLRRSLKMRYQMIDSSNYRGLKHLKHLLIPVLSQNIRRAYQLSVAMESKGFKDGPRTYYYKTPFSYRDLIFIVCIIAILIISYYFAQFFPITGITDVRKSQL